MSSIIEGRGLALEPDENQFSALIDEIRAVLEPEINQLENLPIWTDIEEGYQARDESLEEMLKELFSPGFNPAHPAFLAYIPGGGLVTSALADWLIKSMNRYGTAHFAAPRLADLEYQVIRTFSDWVGYGEESAGVITTGGSLANFTAVVTARRDRLPEDFLKGVLYCSEQTHHSVMKAANLAGFSARNLRLLPTDDNYRLVSEALDEQIKIDRASGMQPFLVVASAGTTNTGSIDPLPEMAEICRRESLWFHVDAAYGGAFILTERGKAKLQGIDRADSITLDPHKGMFLPYGTGSILVKNRQTLIEAHEMRGDYMPDLDTSRAHLDPFSLSVELSREHRGLKIWLPLMLHGVGKFRDALDEKLDLTNYLLVELQGRTQFEILNQPDLSTIAFRIKSASDETNKAYLEGINAGRKVYLSGTVLDGAYALRISILSHRTHREHIDLTLAELDRTWAEFQNQ